MMEVILWQRGELYESEMDSAWNENTMVAEEEELEPNIYNFTPTVFNKALAFGHNNITLM